MTPTNPERPWDFILCPTCGNWIPCPPKGLIPLHPIYVPPGLPSLDGAMCSGGNTFPEKPEWKPNNQDFPTVRSFKMRTEPPTSPEKCPHAKRVEGDWLSTIVNTVSQGPTCIECGIRFVPADVLEEAGRILRENEFRQCNCGMDTEPMECLECPGQIGDGHKDGCALVALLLRIDAVLGNTAKP